MKVKKRAYLVTTKAHIAGKETEFLKRNGWSSIRKEFQTEDSNLRGWCVGFRPLSKQELRRKWQDAVKQQETGGYQGRLGSNRFEDVEFINGALSEYNPLTDQLDAMIHLDAQDPQYVYNWRLQQEAHLREMKGSGMTEEQVIHFVNGYYPAYELFTDTLRAGTFGEEKGRQLRLVIGKDRRVIEVVRI